MRLAGGNVEIDAAQHFAARARIRVAQAAQLDVTANHRRHRFRTAVGDLGHVIEHFEQPLRARRALLPQRHHLSRLPHRPQHHRHVAEERGERADRHFTGRDEAAAITEDDHRRQRADPRHHALNERVRARQRHEPRRIVEIHRVEAFDLVRFLNQRLHRADAVEILLNLLRQRREPFLHLQRLFVHASREPPTEQQQDRQRRQQQQRQRGRQREHAAEPDHRRKNDDENRAQTHADELPHQVDVVDCARHQIAGRMTREEAGTLVLQVVVDSLAQVVRNRNADATDHPAADDDAGEFAEHAQHDRECGPRKRGARRRDVDRAGGNQRTA